MDENPLYADLPRHYVGYAWPTYGCVMTSSLHVPRAEDAARIASLLTPDPLTGSLAGLFLAAPRRTGKTTFLRSDLIPHLANKNYAVIYVDLWSDRSADPADLIVSRITTALEQHDGLISRMRKNSPVDRVGMLGFSVGLKEGGPWSGTIADALEDLIKATGKDLVVIIDEAQQAVETDAGLNAMFALKAARDAINQAPGDRHLYLLMTGSHRDKLSTLVQNRQAPFFGGIVRPFPPLGSSYIDSMAARVNEALAETAKLSPEDLEAAFDVVGRRPELLTDCLRDLIFAPEGAGPEALKRIASERKAQAEIDTLSEIASMTPLQQGILRLMARKGLAFQPFSEETREALKDVHRGRVPAVTTVQTALAALREKGFVWRREYGQYILDNADIAVALARSDDA
ncbi:ATP-binding protein [Limimaricola cinnabarinus]|uniref:ATP-binding protein n=1 Tax=Limimaricola cinnabarinus TaxID=1125964 RepID=UPI0039E28ABA